MGGKGSGRPTKPCSHGIPISKCPPCVRARSRARYVPKKRKHDKRPINQNIVKNYKLSLKHCSICFIKINETNLHMFALDHREPSKKSFALSDARARDHDAVEVECRKCDLMCHNCHHLKTHKNGDHMMRRDEPAKQDEYLPLLLLMENA